MNKYLTYIAYSSSVLSLPCRYLAQFDTSCNTMYTTVMKESNRLKVWGVLGEGTGGYLVSKDRTKLLSKRDLIGKH